VPTSFFAVILRIFAGVFDKRPAKIPRIDIETTTCRLLSCEKTTETCGANIAGALNDVMLA
jgi:hypothetical protein